MKRLLLGLLCLLTCLYTLEAEDMSEIRRQRQELLEQIKKTDQALSANEKSVKNQLYRYNLLNDQIKESEKYLATLNREYNRTKSNIDKLNQESRQLKQELEKKKEQYASMSRHLYVRMKDNDKLMFIFSADNLQQSLRRVRYLNEFARYERKQAEEIKTRQEELDKVLNQLEETRKEQAALVAEQQKERDQLRQERNKQNAIVKDLQKKGKSLQAELKKQKQQAEALNRKIEESITEDNRKSTAPTGEKGTKSTYAMNVDEKKLAADFGKNKGQLPFPVSEPGTIVVHFGEQKHRDMKYVQTNSNCIEIQTTAGASARAIFNGTVSRVFSVPGSNFSVIVRHGNYLSVYSNIANVSVKAGQKVKTSQKIGEIFVDKDQKDLTIMQFQIWKDLQKLDPEAWIKRN
ncbi:MAG: peptidoglycan DD-metalloendopeptidase family protein [Bacteroidales bacterium]|nr:peptidoglycan DD-metalloendopeptidase family protein [Bacteroidales bacterium]